MPLLVELLKLHHHRPRLAGSGVRAAEGWIDGTSDGPPEEDALIVVVSGKSHGSARAAEDVSSFRAWKPQASVVVLLLEPIPFESVLPGFDRIETVPFHECFLRGFRRLFELLGTEFLAKDEILNRRDSRLDRRSNGDRRRGSAFDRLSAGLLLSYCRETGETGFERWDIALKEPRDLLEVLVGEARRYHFFDPVKGRALAPRDVLSRAVRLAWGNPWHGAAPQGAQVLGFIAEEICGRYEVTGLDRRQRDRRAD